MAKLFYTTSEVAAILQCNRRSVQRAIEAGTIPSVRISERTIRIPVAAFHAAMRLDPPVADAPPALRAVS